MRPDILTPAWPTMPWFAGGEGIIQEEQARRKSMACKTRPHAPRPTIAPRASQIREFAFCFRVSVHGVGSIGPCSRRGIPSDCVQPCRMCNISPSACACFLAPSLVSGGGAAARAAARAAATACPSGVRAMLSAAPSAVAK